MSVPRICKYTVPVDGQLHTIELQGPIVHVGSQQPHHVQFWAMNYDDDLDSSPVHFRVVSTGQPFPEKMIYVGSAMDRPYVWHLLKSSTP